MQRTGTDDSRTTPRRTAILVGGSRHTDSVRVCILVTDHCDGKLSDRARGANRQDLSPLGD